MLSSLIARLKRFLCNILGHSFEDRVGIRWFAIGEGLVWVPVDVEICKRCGEFRKYGPPVMSFPQHVNCRCTRIEVSE